MDHKASAQRGRNARSGALPPTMRDVAAAADVSPMTVSRTLRDDPRVTTELRDRVLAAVADLGYRRNDVARSFRGTSSSRVIGLVVTNLGNPFYSELALGVQRVAAEQGLQIMIGNTGEALGREKALVDDFASRRVDGLVVVPSSLDDHAHLDPAGLLDVPVVLATSPPHDLRVDSVLLDDFGGAREATRRLCIEGHARIGFLGLPGALWTGVERLRGYRSAHEELGLPVHESLVRHIEPTDAAADQAMIELMAGDVPPTAIFAANNRHTLAACRYVHHTGRPLRIIGFDDLPTAELFSLPLSVVAYSATELGNRAAELLVRRLEGARESAEDQPERIILPTSLKHYGVSD